MNLKISDQRLKDLLCSAFEGGSNYWIEEIQTHRPKPALAEYWHEDAVYGGETTVIVSESEPIEGKGQVFTLNREALDKGMEVFAEKYPKHFADFIAEDDDAITADVFLQCCLFGDAIFG